jgi:hypothetical protein
MTRIFEILESSATRWYHSQLDFFPPIVAPIVYAWNQEAPPRLGYPVFLIIDEWQWMSSKTTRISRLDAESSLKRFAPIKSLGFKLHGRYQGLLAVIGIWIISRVYGARHVRDSMLFAFQTGVQGWKRIEEPSFWRFFPSPASLSLMLVSGLLLWCLASYLYPDETSRRLVFGWCANLSLYAMILERLVRKPFELSLKIGWGAFSNNPSPYPLSRG